MSALDGGSLRLTILREGVRSWQSTKLVRRARIMRAVNVPMRRSLSFATPLSGNLMLVSYTGKSGKAYRQPVSYVRDGDVLLTPGEGPLDAQPGRRAAGPASGCGAAMRPPGRNWSPIPSS